MTTITQITVDNKTRFAVSIPFSLKDALKKAIPSAEFLGRTKQWHVGTRSVKKLEAFLAEHAQEAAEADARKAAFEEKLSKMVKLTSHTFDIKNDLQEKFGAIFHKEAKAEHVSSAWYVEADVAEEAQAFVDAYNVERKKKTVNEKDLKDAVLVEEKLAVIEKVIKNFKNGDYKYNDDFFFQENLRYECDLPGFLKKLIHVQNEIAQYICFADETDNPGIFDLDAQILRIFGIPAKFAVDFYDHVFIDYKDIEQEKIDKLFAEKQYETVDIEEISKELDDAKHRPVFHIVSKKTGIEFDVTKLVDIEHVQSSSRVAVYHAKNVPILNSESFKTVAYVWWNKSRIMPFE